MLRRRRASLSLSIVATFPVVLRAIRFAAQAGKRRRRLFCDNFHAGHALVVPPVSTFNHFCQPPLLGGWVGPYRLGMADCVRISEKTID